jgi:hypothetical protein
MRIWLAVIAAAGIAGTASNAAAVEYPWCVHYSMEGDASSCGFVSWEQCRQTAFGAAGFCQKNPAYVEPRPRAAAKPKAARRTIR